MQHGITIYLVAQGHLASLHTTNDGLLDKRKNGRLFYWQNIFLREFIYGKSDIGRQDKKKHLTTQITAMRIPSHAYIAYIIFLTRKKYFSN